MTDSTTTQNDRLGMGGNNPPPEEALRDDLAAKAVPIDARIDELEKSVARAPAQFTNEDEAARAAELIADIKAAHKAAEAQKDAMKAPFFKLLNMIQNHWVKRLDRLAAMDAMIRPKLKAWQDAKEREERRIREEQAQLAREAQQRAAREKAEKERKEREAQAEADRLAAEAERMKRAAEETARQAALAAQPAAPGKRAAPKKAVALQRKAEVLIQQAEQVTERAEQAQSVAQSANRDAMLARRTTVTAATAVHHAEKQIKGSITAGRVRGEMGALATLRAKKLFRVTNPDAVPRLYMMVNEAAIDAAINKNGVTEIPGVEIYDDTITSVKG